ncbi:TPA: integrase [Legionella pneumophila subsp. pneumophila]|nr:integrase [Legionella pneumophila subsp. pneumophila]
MARTGLYQSEVKKARDALIAQNIHPSVDAVRVALGNTGSKTTIHKYLKELDAQDGGVDGRKVTVSDAIQDLVGRLAAQLQEEANARVVEIDIVRVEHARLHAASEAARQQEIGHLRDELQRAETAAQQEAAAHQHTREALQQQTIARHTAEEQATGLKERLTENETHRASLEEKHQHAREALKHYRQSMKEQRDQDQRRHEQQVQQLQAEMRQLQQSLVVKQEDVTRLNQEGARLVANLSHAKQALYEQQAGSRQLEQKIEILQAAQQRSEMLATRLQDKEVQITDMKSQVIEATKQTTALSSQVRNLELELAVAHAKLDAQQNMASELRAYMARQEVPPDNAA